MFASLEVSSAAPANGKSDPLPKPNASALDAPLMNPLRDMSISLCSSPKGSKSQEFEEFKEFEDDLVAALPRCVLLRLCPFSSAQAFGSNK
jgi:hypothetical protein